MANWETMLPESLRMKYEIYSFNHAIEILTQAYNKEFAETVDALDNLNIMMSDLIKSGGNESAIPKKLSEILRPLGWQEVKISGDLLVILRTRNPSSETQHTIKNYIDGHNIDYVKGKVALDMEWNSKDQTFDRDLYAFRTFYECGVIACGIIITRSERLNQVFAQAGILHKYGASTTWMGKLIPRIQSGRHGGCPLLVFGILPNAITDWRDDE